MKRRERWGIEGDSVLSDAEKWLVALVVRSNRRNSHRKRKKARKADVIKSTRGVRDGGDDDADACVTYRIGAKAGRTGRVR